MHQSMQDNLCVISLSLIALLEPIQTETANYFSVDINFNVKKAASCKKLTDQIPIYPLQSILVVHINPNLSAT